MGKIIRLTESELVKLVERMVNEAGPGRPQPKFKPGWTADLTSLSRNVIKWSEQKKRYIGQGSDGIYHFFAPKNGKSEFRKVGNNGQNTMGEYIIDNNSQTPFFGIKIKSQRNVTTHPGQLFV